MTQLRISEIVIAGGGTAGWMAAAMLARFLERGFRIRLVESDDIGTVGVGEATIPQIALLNAILGFEEPRFLAATKASYKLGIEFDGWREPGHRYMHAFGSVGRSLGLSPFATLWRRLDAKGLAEPFGRYSFNEVAARAGRMALGAGKGKAVPNLFHAYHFDAGLYARLLRSYAEAEGVERIEGKILKVERHGENGDIAALHLDGERRVPGQFFIDCTGFRGLLIGGALGSAYVDWSHWLPCNRALAVPCARSDAFRPYTQALARKAGWQWRIPLQHRTGNGHVYCSDFISDDEAARILLANLDGEALDEPRQLSFTTGRRERFWVGNCVAVGLAAGFMEPLESTSIQLIQAALTRLITYFLPAGPIDPTLSSQFNRLSVKEWERIRDFLVLHYVSNGRVGEPFWDHCRIMSIPDTLADKVALFRAGGRVVREDDELFTEEAWSQVMIGQGILPESWHPLADMAEDDELAAFARSIADSYRKAAEALPTHAEYVAAVVAQNATEKEMRKESVA